MANKDFAADSVSLSRSTHATETSKKPFSTSAYGTSEYNQNDHPFQTTAYRGKDSGNNFAKSYALPNPADYTKSFSTKSSDLQGKSSTITSTKQTDPFSKPWADGDKPF